MSIIRAPRKESNFYILDKRISEDKRLSWAARGLLVFLLGKPDHWSVNVQALINETKGTRKPVGRDGVYALIDELMLAGYVARSQSRNAAGVLGEVNYLVSESPLPAQPYPAAPLPARPHPANPTLVSNDSSASTDSEQALKGKARAQAPAPAPTFPKLDDFDAEQAEAQAAAQAEAASIAAEQKAAAAAQEADQEAAKAQAKAQAPAKVEKPTKAAKTAEPASTIACPADVPAGVFVDFLTIRKAKRAPLTNTALDGIRREADKAGLSLADALAVCCERGWVGFRADWYCESSTLAAAKTTRPHARRAPANEDFAGTDYGVRRKL